MTIIKYEPEIRNKAILTLLWDLDARNHTINPLRRIMPLDLIKEEQGYDKEKYRDMLLEAAERYSRILVLIGQFMEMLLKRKIGSGGMILPRNGEKI
ncbi:MAG TPA: hypothetical protein VFI73_06625 [Candidatus Nitrosopolaris sp.]|nr:hypothetical protein [Candidatus Nitrosopolaris sp.]